MKPQWVDCLLRKPDTLEFCPWSHLKVAAESGHHCNSPDHVGVGGRSVDLWDLELEKPLCGPNLMGFSVGIWEIIMMTERLPAGAHSASLCGLRDRLNDSHTLVGRILLTPSAAHLTPVRPSVHSAPEFLALPVNLNIHFTSHS